MATLLGRLRRARLLAQEDSHNPGRLDTHPLVREYFGEQLRSQQTGAWKECNRRLFLHYQTLAPQLPNSFREMERLFSAIICGCNAGLFREALREVYIPRIQRGDARFAANVLGARAALLTVLVHFFEQGRWGSLVESGVEEERLTPEDQLFVLMQAALYLMVTRGLRTPEVRICYERAESLCHSLNRPRIMHVVLIGQWRYSLFTDRLTATMRLAKAIYSLAQDRNDSALLMGACRAIAVTFYFLGDFEATQEYAMRGVQIWRSGSVQSPVEEVNVPPVLCLSHQAQAEWHFGEIARAHATMAEAVSLAKELNGMHGLALALYYSAVLSYCESNPAEVERFASALIELSTRQNFPDRLAGGEVLRGWAGSASGDTAEGISWIEDGMEDTRATGPMMGAPFLLALKAEALYLADRTAEGLEAINEAGALAERSEARWWCAELHRLRGVFLASLGAEETQIEASLQAAISTARQQKSVSLEKRAEATYAEYGRQKGSLSGGRGVRLPLS